MTNRKIENINFGLTFSGVLSTFGMLSMIMGIIITIIADWIAGIVIIVPSLILFISIKGVIVDYENMKIKSYLNILIAKFGIWQNINSFSNIQLRKINESMGMYSRGTNTRVNTKSYDIYLYNKNNNSELLLRSYRKFDEATAMLKEYASKFNLEIDYNIKDMSFKKKN